MTIPICPGGQSFVQAIGLLTLCSILYTIELGGILPKVEGLKSYIARNIGASSNLQPLPGDERLLYFIQFIAEKFPDEPYPARRAAVLLPLIAKLSEYNIRRDTISGAERFTEDEWNRLEEYLETAKAFRAWLSKKNLFMPELELARLDKITPGEKEIFIGLARDDTGNRALLQKDKKRQIIH